MTTGFEVVNQLLTIKKDPQAVLTYTFDWSEWLIDGDSLDTVNYTLQVRANDPSPIVKIGSDIIGGNKTWIKLSGGQVERTYIVTASITTALGLTDRRNFRVNVANRSA